jgi:hypothetical protein
LLAIPLSLVVRLFAGCAVPNPSPRLSRARCSTVSVVEEVSGSGSLLGIVKDILNPLAVTKGVPVEWEILMTTQVEAFPDALYESGRDSHRLVNQAILVLERNGPAEGASAGGHGNCFTDLQHEGVAPTVGG